MELEKERLKLFFFCQHQLKPDTGYMVQIFSLRLSFFGFQQQMTDFKLVDSRFFYVKQINT